MTKRCRCGQYLSASLTIIKAYGKNRVTGKVSRFDGALSSGASGPGITIGWMIVHVFDSLQLEAVFEQLKVIICQIVGDLTLVKLGIAFLILDHGWCSALARLEYRRAHIFSH